MFLVGALVVANKIVFAEYRQKPNQEPWGGPLYSSEAALISQAAVGSPTTVIDAEAETIPEIQEYNLVNKAEVISEDSPGAIYVRPMQALPNLAGYFKKPAEGFNWGRLHYRNAVDIASICGDEIYAAADGTIVEALNNNSWNGGYGNYIKIEHPNGTKTLYAHTLENLKEAGNNVKQGEVIAYMGNTGNVDGDTGCHVHFEVWGAENPFANNN